MTPEIEKQIVSLIEAAKQAGSDASSFIAQQAPDAVAQLIQWNIWEGALDAVVGAFVICLAHKIFRITYDKHQAGEVDEIVWAPVSVIILVMTLFGSFSFFVGSQRAIKAVVAPKVLILETIGKLGSKN